MKNLVVLVALVAFAVGCQGLDEGADEGVPVTANVNGELRLVGQYDPASEMVRLELKVDNAGLELESADATLALDPRTQAAMLPADQAFDSGLVLVAVRDDGYREAIADLHVGDDAASRFKSETAYADDVVIIDGPNGTPVAVWCDDAGCHMIGVEHLEE